MSLKPAKEAAVGAVQAQVQKIVYTPTQTHPLTLTLTHTQVQKIVMPQDPIPVGRHTPLEGCSDI